VLSKTTRYALWVLAALAQGERQGHLHARGLAARLGIPAPYLAKVMSVLSRHGFVDSVRGRAGGYRLKEEALGASLKTVVALFDPSSLAHVCMIGNPHCPGPGCGQHDRWNALQRSFVEVLETTTIADLAARRPRVAQTGV